VLFSSIFRSEFSYYDYECEQIDMSDTGSVGIIRTSKGTFAPGTVRGPGNPVAKRVHDLKQAVLNATTPAQVRAVLGKIREMAMAGDMQAAALWFDRVLGKAKEHAQVDVNLGSDAQTDLAAFRAAVLRRQQAEESTASQN
jgi:hypothetical protein